MNIFHLSGPKFYIAAEMFCMVKFLNFLLGLKFVAVEFFSKNAKIGSKKANFAKGPPLAMPNCTKTLVSHIILNGSMYKWNPASGILNELSDCILYRQTNGTLWINFGMFFWTISSKKSTFLRFTHQNLLTPPPYFTTVVNFFSCFFLVASQSFL